MGRLWIASDEGINVFDGQSLISYSYPDHSGLLHNNITQIYCDRNGVIWVAHNKGMQYLLPAAQRFQTLSLPAPFNPGELLIGETDTALVVLSRTGCYTVDSRYRVRTTEWVNDLVMQHGFPYAIEKLNGDEWLWGCGRALLRVNFAQRQVVRKYAYEQAWALQKMNDSLVLCGSFARAQTALVHLHTGAVSDINNWPSDDGRAMGGYVGAIFRAGEDRYVLSGRYDGVYLVDVRRKFVQHFVHDPADVTSLNTNYCRSLYVTRNGTLFVHGKGLSYASLHQPLFHAVRGLVDQSGSPYRSVVNCFAEDENGSMWIGTNKGLLQWREGKAAGNFILHRHIDNTPGRWSTIRHLAKDHRGRLWAGTFGGGLAVLENGRLRAANKFRKGDYVPGRIPNVFALIPDGGQQFLVCSYAGLYLYDAAQEQLQLLDNHPVLQPIARNRSFYALVDRQGNWWLAQSQGLFYYEKAANKLSRVILPNEHSEESIQCVAEDSSGNIYAGGFNGVYVIDRLEMKVSKCINRQDGLSSDHITGLLCDKKGHLWIIGNRGLSRYEPSTNRLTSFDVNDGLLSGNHQFSSYYLAKDGKIYIGNVDGFYYFHPDSIRQQATAIPVYITQLASGDSVITTAEETVHRLSWRQQHVTFSYLAVDYKSGPDLQYRYRLQGFDTGYVYAGRERRARYTNLPAGQYRFTAEVSANGKDWFAARQPVTIIIGKAFWTTWWFQCSILAILALLGWFFYRRRVQQISREAQIRADYEIRLNELENSALRTQMNPHFIFNCLNTINAFINSNDRILANQYISKFSRLIRLILDHSRQKKITLAEELEALELYIQIERFRFDNKFEYALVIDERLDPSTTEIPSLMIQPFVENAILHGLLPLKQPGKLSVQLQLLNERLLCIIEDNGVGRAFAAKNPMHKMAGKKSHGMEITMKRIELFNKENGLEARPVITDGKDELGHPRGTRVEIMLAWLPSY
jgi:Putative regulator of cell autolysis